MFQQMNCEDELSFAVCALLYLLIAKMARLLSSLSSLYMLFACALRIFTSYRWMKLFILASFQTNIIISKISSFFPSSVRLYCAVHYFFLQLTIYLYKLLLSIKNTFPIINIIIRSFSKGRAFLVWKEFLNLDSFSNSTQLNCSLHAEQKRKVFLNYLSLHLVLVCFKLYVLNGEKSLRNHHNFNY
jgi:hypothetical protein